MGETARVTSVAALRDMKLALADFIDQVNIAFAGVDADIGRVTQWLQHDRPAYYKNAVRRAQEEVTRIKSEISRKQYMRAPEPVSVVEEKKKLDKLQRRLEDLQRKQDNVRKWAPRWEREAMMYKSSCRPLTECVQSTLPRAIESLEKMAVSIEEYLRLQVNSADIPPADPGLLDQAWKEGEAGAPPIQTTVEKYAPLRAMLLSPEAAAALRPGPIETPWNAGVLSDSDARSLSGLSTADAPPGDDDLLFVSWRAVACNGVFFVRRPAAPTPAPAPAPREDGLRDSGWFVGPLDRPEEPGGYACTRVKSFCRLVPSLKPLLALRPGYLAVLSAGVLKSVLDESDRELWHSPEV